MAFTPLIVYLIWKFSYYGAMFDYVQTVYFFRALLVPGKGFSSWATPVYAVVTGHAPGRPDLVMPGGYGVHSSIYMLVAPVLFISLAHWGKNMVFGRAWTLISLLWMGFLAMLYAFNFRVA